MLTKLGNHHRLLCLEKEWGAGWAGICLKPSEFKRSLVGPGTFRATRLQSRPGHGSARRGEGCALPGPLVCGAYRGNGAPAELRMGRGQPECALPLASSPSSAEPSAMWPLGSQGNLQGSVSDKGSASREPGVCFRGFGGCQQLPSSLARLQNHLPTGTRASGGTRQSQACALCTWQASLSFDHS